MYKSEKLTEKVVVVDSTKLNEPILLSKEQKNSLISDLRDDINDCIIDKEDVMAEIMEIREQLHIEPDYENEVAPFEGASNYRDPLSSAHEKIIASMLARTLIANPIWLIDLSFQPEYEKWLNEALASYSWNTLNVEPILRRTVQLAVKEIASFVEIYDYNDEYYEIVTETYLPGEIIDFIAKYPSHKDLGLKSRKEYNDLTDTMAKDIDMNGEARVQMYKKRIDSKIGMEIRSIDEIFILPWNSCDIQNAKGVFSRVEKTNNDLKEAARIGYYDSDAVDEVLNFKPNKDYEQSSYDSTMDARFNVDDTPENEYFRNIYQGIYRFVLDEEVGEEEFYIHYALEESQILRIERYQRIMNFRNIVPFCVLPEHNKIIGNSLIKELSHTQDLVDSLWNQIIDNNHFSNVPFFKTSIDEASEPLSSLYSKRMVDRVEISPGKVIMLKNPDGFNQVQTSTLNMQAMSNFINMAQRSAESLDGATQLLSGRENSADPSAPARKTELQLGQSTLRIDDYVRDLRPSLNTLGLILLFKCINIQPKEWKNYQKQFMKANKDNPTDSVALHPQDLNFDAVVLDIMGQSLMKNKDSIANDLMMVMSTLLQVPQLGQNPKTLSILLSKFLSNKGYNSNEIKELLEPLLVQVAQVSAQMDMVREGIDPNSPDGMPPVPPELPGEVLEEAGKMGLEVSKPEGV